VTERGVLVALLVPPHPASGVREELVATGRLIPATGPLRLPRRAPALPGMPDTGAILDELREERS
jgi:hypothetical protein